MFKIPMRVAQIDERLRQDYRVIQLTLTETNEDDRMTISEIAISLKIRPDGDDEPAKGFERSRFKVGQIWNVVLDES